MHIDSKIRVVWNNCRYIVVDLGVQIVIWDLFILSQFAFFDCNPSSFWWEISWLGEAIFFYKVFKTFFLVMYCSPALKACLETASSCLPGYFYIISLARRCHQVIQEWYNENKFPWYKKNSLYPASLNPTWRTTMETYRDVFNTPPRCVWCYVHHVIRQERYIHFTKKKQEDGEVEEEEGKALGLGEMEEREDWGR